MTVEKQVRAALSSLEKMSTKRDRTNLAKFGINATDASARWVGKDALRDLTRPLVTRRMRTG
jgi:hypothetical protein